jgi:hypothetical protein
MGDFLKRTDVNAWLGGQGAWFLWNEAAPVLPPVATAEPKAATLEPSPVVTHSTKSTRSDALTPVIKRAQSQCGSPDDVAQVWTQLEKLAGEKYGPLVQMTQGELTYSEGGEARTISREAISKRIKRAAVKRR